MKANRTLDNLLKAIARTYYTVATTEGNTRQDINIEDINKAYSKVYNTNEFPTSTFSS
ncbi:hypothetical protein [Candidatus Phytoplasma fraxini]|uniref:Uncharacterized protein n=1 Tax=Ash yellows phytoplasma TaxID=35780 RepID=A0ABZ2U9Z4_ASHYP